MSAVDEPVRPSPGERHPGRLATAGPRGLPHVVPTGWSDDPERRYVLVTTVRDGLIAASRDHRAGVTAPAGP